VTTIRRVLVRAPNWIGDAVLSLGAVRDLRRNFPTARIEVLARSSVADMYHAVSEVDGVRVATGRFRHDARALRGAFDAAVLLTNSFATALLAFAAGIPERWGYSRDARGLLLTRRARVPRGLRGCSEVYYYRGMLAGLGFQVSATPDVSLSAPEAWKVGGAALLGDEGPWIAVNPGAAYGSAKQWAPERFATVAERLRGETGAKVAVVGGASERLMAEALVASSRVRARILCGRTTLPELIGVLANSRLLLTNDSGPMHLAAAQGVPVVAVFGPTDWRETAPVGGPYRIVREEVECAPCKLRECPIDHRCMTRVTADRVVDAARVLWSAARV
jgi:lipopolysaccharide heptosyltransferase II